MPFPIQHSRWAEALRRWLGLQGTQGLQLIDDVFPVVPLVEAEAPDQFYLRDVLRFAEGVGQAASVGNISGVFLSNAAEQLLVIEQVWVHGASVAYHWRAAVELTGGPGTGGLMNPRDARAAAGITAVNAAAGASTGFITNAVNTIGRQFFGHTPVNGMNIVEPGVVLEPASRFMVQTEPVNTEIDVCFIFRVRRLYEQERRRQARI